MSTVNLMTKTELWDTWKKRWKITEDQAIETVKEIFRLGGTRPVEKRKIVGPAHLEEALDFAIELGWLKDCFTGTYKLTTSGLLMLSHRFKT